MEDGLFRDGQFVFFFLSQDGHAARPQNRVLVPHELHPGQICGEGNRGIHKALVKEKCILERKKMGQLKKSSMSK